MISNCEHNEEKKHKKKKKPVTFQHPFQLAFCGYSGTGKTTLIKNLTSSFSANKKIGYFKHDAHSFEMDKEGKDTFEVMNSGASAIMINDPNHSAKISSGELGMFETMNALMETDFLFVEGYKNSEIPKLVLIDKEEKILPNILKGEFNNIIGLVGSKKNHKNLPNNIPFFHRNDVEEIKEFILDTFVHKAEAVPFYGLVLTGGKSKRMGKDKAFLEYNGTPQYQRGIDLLSGFCDEVFLSCREEQSEQFSGKINKIYDTFLDTGSLAGILSAQSAHPGAAWFVLACDLPYIQEADINFLIESRNPFKVATAYGSVEENLPEPMCAIYEPKSFSRLMSFLGFGYKCPRKILLNSETNLIKPLNNHALNNVNHPEEFEEAVRFMKDKI